VIGGGFYGATVAAHLAARTGRVSLIEAGPHLLGRASFANQARVHAGYHYPRSILTALRSSVNFERFCATYAEAVDSDFVSLYAIARESKVTAAQFATVCEAIGAPVRPADATLRRWFATDLVEEVFVTRECAFNAERLRERAERDLTRSGVDCRTGVSALAVEPTAGDRVLVVDSEGHRWNAGTVFACVYAQTNTLLHRSGLPRLPLKHELAEIPLLDVGPLAGLGITVMDGPFFSVMPFPARRRHSIHHVRYSPHYEWRDTEVPRDAYAHMSGIEPESNVRYMLADARRYVPALDGLKPTETLFEIKTVLMQNEVDDGRPILFRPHHGIPNFSVLLGAKIDNIYDALDAIERFGVA
jgi:glycine/D-amino acid oxidase-like deaminating enzyme